MKKITLEQAKRLYRLGGDAKDIVLDLDFSEEELTQPSYTIEESDGNITIEGTIEGHQFNSFVKIGSSQTNGFAQIGGDQSNYVVKIEGDQYNRFTKINGNQTNYGAKISGLQSNNYAKISGDQKNFGTKIEGKMWIDEDTEYKGGIWLMKEDGSEIEMQLTPKE